jgi:RimJ/RimL family protein N-acetyltransferase
VRRDINNRGGARNGVFSAKGFRSDGPPMAPHLTLRAAIEADLNAIMAIERTAGFELYVGRSAAAEHRAMMASPNYAYLVGEAGEGRIAAFAILRDLGDPHGNLYLKRIAVSRPGEGVGGAFLALVVAWAFAHTEAHRFWLDCFVHNARAQRAYEKLGFTHDGVAREAYRADDGSRVDLAIMAITRPEWAARAPGG